MDALRRLDHIAYIRFASVYRAFTDLASLKEALEALEEGRVPSVEERSLQLPLIGNGDERAFRPRVLQDVESRHFAESEGHGAAAWR